MVPLLFWIGILHEIIVVRHLDGKVTRIAPMNTQQNSDRRCTNFGLEKSLQVTHLLFLTSHQQLRDIYTPDKIRGYRSLVGFFLAVHSASNLSTTNSFPQFV